MSSALSRPRGEWKECKLVDVAERNDQENRRDLTLTN